MQSRVKWLENMTFVGQSASGHSVVLDGNGGEKAPSPMELVLMAAGGCSSVDVVSGLQELQQQITGCEVEISAERREQAPRIFTHANLHFVVTGHDLNDQLVSKVVADSLEKYCSVCLMLGQGVEMSHSYKIVVA
ncbi:OsmC family protein [Photobacterium carnosum]|jgi:putative redox protein|uniref:OsmC family protein n=1 Tax=Photobacterium carnosum TaxID=2023717 RepID=UPI00128D5CD9|nr:OsmC family protein [Photobacterium carnosum]KAE8176903.1 osmotically inducible protein OsmC [Photobacterium carnosum]MCD9522294.1 OsmC family protein [Photobacterium carnosum]MCD9529387.1 OsmC family protein [Photobacterium carnosum]MCF2153636.1 OsmC family protein [Photobacterium carnosum]MCF2215492.1 OsmC family protein [Photobacterium carnosum]